MSTIRTDNFGPSAGGTTYSARGIAKAWVNFNGTGTIAARDSENVSSLTDNGTGDYTVNFTNAFGAADYAGSAMGALDISGAPPLISNVSVSRTGAQTASAFRIQTYFYATSSNALGDFSQVQISIHGDLA
jgi:hypothetical protein